jgi:hypothetical protein
MHYRQHKDAVPRVEGRKAGDRSLRAGGRLPAILKLNLAFLVGLAALSFFLPFSGTERWFLAVPVALLAGVNWALLERPEIIPPKPPARGG